MCVCGSGGGEEVGGGLGARSAGVGCAPRLSQIAAVMDGPDLLPPYLVPGENHV